MVDPWTTRARPGPVAPRAGSAVGGEGLGHLPETGRQHRAPGTPACHEPRRDQAVPRVPRQAVGLTDGRWQQADRRPQGPVVQGGRHRQPAERARQWRPQDHPGQLAGQGPDLDRPGRIEHPGPVGVERLDVARKPRVGDPERPSDRPRLLVEPRPPRPVERLEPGLTDRQGRLDERGVDPQRQLRVARRIARPDDPAMERVQTPDLAAGRRRRPVHDREIAPQRAAQPAPGIGAEVRVVVDPGRDGRVRDLEQQRARAGAEQKHRLAVEPPGLGAGAVQAGDVGRDRARRTRRPLQGPLAVDPLARHDRTHRCTIPTITEGRGP